MLVCVCGCTCYAYVYLYICKYLPFNVFNLYSMIFYHALQLVILHCWRVLLIFTTSTQCFFYVISNSIGNLATRFTNQRRKMTIFNNTHACGIRKIITTTIQCQHTHISITTIIIIIINIKKETILNTYKRSSNKSYNNKRKKV